MGVAWRQGHPQITQMTQIQTWIVAGALLLAHTGVS
jgi:hypothetical protein